MRVLVAMSGGVDSSVAAALALRRGMEPVGVTMRLLDRDPSQRTGGRGCCGIEAVRDARRVAARLGIPHFALDFRGALEHDVIADFCSEYARGRTPNPCIRCNDILKFRVLLDRLPEFDAERLVTGHHARIVAGGGQLELRRATDRNKDQTYFLYRMNQAQLARVLMPVGEYGKDEVREAARGIGLAVADKPDSQEICFIPDDDYASFLEKRRPGLFRPGPVFDTGGNEVGRHEGIARYTVGQRRGLGIPFGERRYVVSIDPVRNAVVVGTEEEARSRHAELEQVHWVAGRAPGQEFRAAVKIRNVHAAAPAQVRVPAPDRAEVEFDEPQWAVAPGQAAVCYDGDRVLGGGIIRAGA